MKKTFLIFISLALCMFLLTGCKKQTLHLSQRGLYFDTAIQLTVYGEDNTQLENALKDAFDLCQTYENMLSRTVEGSDVYNINHAGGEWVTVSDETIRILNIALSYCRLSDGHIDITIAPVKDLWNFSTLDHSGTLPDAFSLSGALHHVDYTTVEIDGNNVRINSPGEQIDLGFIAKGFIADEIKASFISNNVDAALIDLGGNILVLGEKPDQTPFKVGLQKPFADSGEILTSVTASDALGINTVVTSGVYERYFYEKDQLYHHVLDGDTGYPVDNHLYSVTILANSSIHADALSTTCLVMGLDWSKEMIASLDGVEAIFVTDEMEVIDTRVRP